LWCFVGSVRDFTKISNFFENHRQVK